MSEELVVVEAAGREERRGGIGWVGHLVAVVIVVGWVACR